MKLSEIIALFGGYLEGDDVTVNSIAQIKHSSEQDITFIVSRKYKDDLIYSKARAVIISAELNSEINIPKIVVDDPYYYFSKVSQLFNLAKKIDNKVHSTLIYGSNCIFNNSSIAAYVVFGNNVTIHNNCQIHPHVTIGNNVTIGQGSIIYPNVTIYDNVTIGENSIIHSGVVLGSDGFGYAINRQNKSWSKIPQIGGVNIGSDVEIGANTTVDAGTFSTTIIHNGVKIDNLVQIAHNVTIGEHTAIAACTGIAGSSVIGKHCQLGGGVGIGGHISITDNVIVGAFTGVSKTITTPGVYVGHYPADNFRNWAKNIVKVKQLYEMDLQIKQIQQRIDKKDIK